jgi:glutamate dehydrogenase (NADP+)
MHSLTIPYLKINEFMAKVIARNPGEVEFHQAVKEVANSVLSILEKNPQYRYYKILERIVEPERVIIFRVPWHNDMGEIQINQGFLVQMSSSIGPFKGGLRFHSEVNLGTLKFLAFEQVFKNSLTGLPIGGSSGGSDFDPKDKSDNEVMKFCQSFMTELSRHIGPFIDIQGGDIGVAGREIGYLFGQYKRLKNEFSVVITGKGIGWGGSLLRPESPGYGCVYFAEEMLKTRGQSLKGKIVAISGSGNVAQYAVEKAYELGAVVVSLSDSNGYIYDPKGIDEGKLEFIRELKNNKRGRIKEYAVKYKCKYEEGEKPWNIKCQIAIPCAIQNEIEENDAINLINNGCICVAEGSNMPSTPEAIKVFKKKGILFGPSKAANAGGVATSGLEMSQNSMRLSWSRKEVDEKLKTMMANIHATCVKYGQDPDSYIDYRNGANIGGFVKIANAMIDQGLV